MIIWIELYLRVPEFEASKYMVTNRQYVDFVREGGYGKREFWTDEGWEWIKYKKAKHPSFWVCEEGEGNHSQCTPVYSCIIVYTYEEW